MKNDKNSKLLLALGSALLLAACSTTEVVLPEDESGIVPSAMEEQMNGMKEEENEANEESEQVQKETETTPEEGEVKLDLSGVDLQPVVQLTEKKQMEEAPQMVEIDLSQLTQPKEQMQMDPETPQS